MTQNPCDRQALGHLTYPKGLLADISPESGDLVFSCHFLQPDVVAAEHAGRVGRQVAQSAAVAAQRIPEVVVDAQVRHETPDSGTPAVACREGFIVVL